MKYLKQLFFVLLLFNFSITKGQKIETFLDSSNAEIGEIRKFTIVIHLPNYNINWMPLEDTICKGLEIHKVSKLDTLLLDNGFMFTQVYEVMAFDTGYYLIHPIKINFGDSVLSSNPNLLRIDFAKIDFNTDIKDIDAILDTPFIFAEIKNLILGILTFLILIVIVYILIRKYLKNKKIKSITKPKIKISPYDWHIQKIKQLEELKLWQNGKEKEYQIEISYLLRSILEHKFSIPILEETTQNIIYSLQTVHLNQDQINQIKTVLTFADFVKYAKGKGMDFQHQNSIQLLKDLVELLKDDDAK